MPSFKDPEAIARRARRILQSELKELAELLNWKANLARITFAASATLARTDTAGKDLFVVPEGHEGHALIVHGEIGSDAGTSAILDVGRTGLPTTFVNGWSVLGNAGVGQKAPPARKLGVVSGADIQVTGRYAETGTPSTVGGPWTVTLLYSKGGS